MIPSEKRNNLYIFVAALVFDFVLFFHLLIIIFDWDLKLNDMIIPKWISILVCLLAGFLSFKLYKQSRILDA